MPNGVLQWLDTDRGVGRVLGNGRRYAVRVGDVDTKARHAGARVHFDVDHSADGDAATNVVLREGTRVSPGQRRFGDLVGARTRETKADVHSAELTIGRDRVRHPMRVAQWWAEHLTAGAIDDAIRLYAPTAVLHIAGDIAVGPDRIRARLLSTPVFGSGVGPEAVEGSGDALRVRWAAIDDDGDPIESHLVVEHGEIVEQWHGAVRTTIDAPTGRSPIALSVEGRVPAAQRSEALDRVTRATQSLSEPVHHVAIRLEWLADPGRERRARARATLDVGGDTIRASVRGQTMTEAIDLLDARLVERIRHRSNIRTTLRRRGPTSGPGEWRHGDRPGGRGREPSVAAEDRAVVRRPTWSAEPSTLDEAVFDLEALDLEFLLFVDLASGMDAVVHRNPDGSYAVRFSRDLGDEQTVASVAAVTVDHSPTPHITLDEAREHLDGEGRGWVFFHDVVSNRGAVLYRRDDGHDGLITPRIDAPTA